jgi:hypothetical protein
LKVHCHVDSREDGHRGYRLGTNSAYGIHPLLGRRMPDLDLVTANGPLRVFTLQVALP